MIDPMIQKQQAAFLEALVFLNDRGKLANTNAHASSSNLKDHLDFTFVASTKQATEEELSKAQSILEGWDEAENLDTKEEIKMKTEFEMPIGTRMKAIDFIDTFTVKYLADNGFKQHNCEGMIREVKTKHGRLIVELYDTLTYVGKGVWSVEHNDE